VWHVYAAYVTRCPENQPIDIRIWPIRVFTILGAVLFGLGFLSGVLFLVSWLLNGTSITGWGIVAWGILTGTGVQLLFLGVLGEYLGKLFMAHSSLPAYVIKKECKIERAKE